MPTDHDMSSRRTGASPAAIISHYDMGDDFFKLVLGPEMIYSCAAFEDGEDLATAQRRKLDHHIGAAGVMAVRMSWTSAAAGAPCFGAWWTARVWPVP
ncbi:MAG: Cyclopropane fatty acid synthase [Tardiphaga sp.]|nr:Cyclopropane fatty acid synthase [Tardiphaga sp.]